MEEKRERIKKRKRWGDRERVIVMLSLIKYVSHLIFTKVSLNNVIWKLKSGKKSFLNLVFKHSKMRNITQMLLIKFFTKHVIFFRAYNF